MKTKKRFRNKTATNKPAGQRLLPEAVREELPSDPDDEADPTVFVRLFCPWAPATWFIVSGSKAGAGLSRYRDDFICLAFAATEHAEWGLVSIAELEAVRGPCGLRIERDLHFRPARFSSLHLECSAAGHQDANSALAPFELQVLRVGEPYVEGQTGWNQGTHVLIEPGGITFAVVLDKPSKRELRVLHEGRISMRLLCMSRTMMFLARLGDTPWMDAPFSVHRVPEQCRQAPPAPAPGHGWLAVLVMIDAESGIVCGIRPLGLSREFSCAVLRAYQEQQARIGDDAKHVREVMEMRRKSPAVLAAEAPDRFEQGDTAN